MPIPGVERLEEAEESTNNAEAAKRALSKERSSSEDESSVNGTISDDSTNSNSDFSKDPDAHAPASFSKLMAEIGGAWRILVFMAFLASVLAFTYLILLRFFSGPIIWVSIDFFRPPKP